MNELSAVMFTQRTQNLFAFGSEADGDAPQIRRILPALYQPFLHRPIHQLYRAVVLNEKTARDVLNTGYSFGRRPLHGQHELMLLRLDGGVTGNARAEVQKSANLEAKLCKVLIVRLGAHEFTLP